MSVVKVPNMVERARVSAIWDRESVRVERPPNAIDRARLLKRERTERRRDRGTRSRASERRDSRREREGREEDS